MPPRPLALIGALLLGLAAAPGLDAQPSADPRCRDALASAEQRYTEQAYDAVEALVRECVSQPTAAADDLVEAHRLLALAFIKQDLMTEAQGAVIKLLSADFSYEPDRLLDLPLYVALVDVVKDQLSVAVLPRARVERPLAVADAPASVLPVQATSPSLIDVNTASAEMLDTVPGIGPAIAGRILAFRAQNGPFRSVADLEQVRGIGPRTLERMAPYLTAGRPTMLASSAGGGVSSVTPTVEPAPPARSGALVNLNTATAEELDTLDGIGPALAGRIIEFRTTNGPFRSVSDVLQVRGIGPRTLEGFAEQVTVE
ncbi:ComEA family DNA-binding protein [Rubrivirga sp.]|uniref:ComEA family DNA-binding protein n=1 Tax=Rubrivirga sp. TaxID=1885344 RepID=UPI003B51D7A1